MPLEILDILKANVVLLNTHLLAQPDDIPRLSASLATEVTSAGSGIIVNASTGVQQPAQSFQLNRDRITIEVSPVRSTFDREYPDLHDLPRLADVVNGALSLRTSAQTALFTVGYNVELVYDPGFGMPAELYIAEKTLRHDVVPGASWELNRGFVQLGYSDGLTQWNVKLEPRFGDHTTHKVFFSLNAHYDAQEITSAEAVLQSLQATWDMAHQYITQLDRSSI